MTATSIVRSTSDSLTRFAPATGRVLATLAPSFVSTAQTIADGTGAAQRFVPDVGDRPCDPGLRPGTQGCPSSKEVTDGGADFLDSRGVVQHPRESRVDRTTSIFLAYLTSPRDSVEQVKNLGDVG